MKLFDIKKFQTNTIRDDKKMLAQKIVLENEKFVCPLCGTEVIYSYDEEKKDQKKTELDLIKEEDWSLP